MPKVKLERMDALKYMDNVFLWTDYNSEHPFPKGSWNSKIFGNNNPIVLELACGKGEYSIALGQKYPNKNYVGFDLKGNRLWVGANIATEKDFPDPQLKKDRKKLTSPKFLALYKPLLKRGATINLKTDSSELYTFTLDVINNQGLKLHTNIIDIYADTSIDPDLNIQTYYENMHLRKGRKIHFLSFSLD